jgi:hypothetical protein
MYISKYAAFIVNIITFIKRKTTLQTYACSKIKKSYIPRDLLVGDNFNQNDMILNDNHKVMLNANYLTSENCKFGNFQDIFSLKVDANYRPLNTQGKKKIYPDV